MAWRAWAGRFMGNRRHSATLLLMHLPSVMPMPQVRAGTGGEEAALWAADLIRMYQKYADAQVSMWFLLVCELDRHRLAGRHDDLGLHQWRTWHGMAAGLRHGMGDGLSLHYPLGMAERQHGLTCMA